MLHHFPSRFELVRSAVAHLNRKRLALFEREEMRIQKNAKQTRVAEGIDSYWRQLNTKLFVVFHELQVAARVDVELRKILVPAITEFDERWQDMVERVFPDLSQSHNFVLGNFLTLFLLEGMAVNDLRRTGKWTDILLNDLKDRLVNDLYSDITEVDRTAKPRQHRRKHDGDEATDKKREATVANLTNYGRSRLSRMRPRRSGFCPRRECVFNWSTRDGWRWA